MQDNKDGGLSWSQPAGTESVPQPKQTQATWNKVPAPVVGGSVSVTHQHGSNSQISDRSGLVLSFVAGLVVGGLVMWVWVAVSSTDGGAANSETNTAAFSNSAARTALTPGVFTAPSVQSAGLAVSVTAVSVFAPTWIVVYENRDGAPGNALGAALFTPESTGGSINLLRGTIPGQTYFIGQRRDNGDRVFSLEGDTPVLDQSGKPVLAQFTTQ